jgi:hypothetical protein
MFAALGQTWTMEPVSPGVRKKMSAWARLRARQDLFSQRAEMPDAIYRECLVSVNEQITAGAYSWGSPLDDRRMGSGLMELLQTHEAQAELARLLLDRNHPGIEPQAIFAIMVDNAEGFATAMREALELGHAPNPRTPQDAATTKVTTPATTPAD